MIHLLIATLALLISAAGILVFSSIMWLWSLPLDWLTMIVFFSICSALVFASLLPAPPLFIEAIALRSALRRDTIRLERWNNLSSIAGTLSYAAWVVTDSSSSDEARERLQAEEMKVREKQKELRQ